MERWNLKRPEAIIQYRANEDSLAVFFGTHRMPKLELWKLLKLMQARRDIQRKEDGRDNGYLQCFQPIGLSATQLDILVAETC